MTRKRFLLYGGVLFIVFIIALSISGYWISDKKDLSPYETVAMVGETPIAVGELQLFYEHNRTDTYIYFTEKYQMEITDDFWETSYEGEVPREVCIRTALKQLKQIKIEQKLMLDYGLVANQDIAYEGFYRYYESERERRAKASNKEEPIYGVTDFKVKEYYDYVHSNRLIQLGDKVKDLNKEVQSYELMETTLIPDVYDKIKRSW